MMKGLAVQREKRSSVQLAPVLVVVGSLLVLAGYFLHWGRVTATNGSGHVDVKGGGVVLAASHEATPGSPKRLDHHISPLPGTVVFRPALRRGLSGFGWDDFGVSFGRSRFRGIIDRQ